MKEYKLKFYIGQTVFVLYKEYDEGNSIIIDKCEVSSYEIDSIGVQVCIVDLDIKFDEDNVFATIEEATIELIKRFKDEKKKD